MAELMTSRAEPKSDTEKAAAGARASRIDPVLMSVLSSRFEAIIREVSGSVVSPLWTPEIRTLDPEDALRQFAANFMEIVLSPTVTALYRVVIPEVRRFPELGELFYHSGPGRAVKTLAAYLRDQSERGILEVADANLAAQQFLGMLAGIPNIRRLLDIGEEPSKRERKRIVREAVRRFLKAHRPPILDSLGLER